MANTFLRNDGQFKPVLSGDVSTSTSTNTSALLSFVTASSTVNITGGSTFTNAVTVTQGTSGTWLATGQLTLGQASTNLSVFFRLWDGTTVMASGSEELFAGDESVISIAGVISNPAGNIKLDFFGNANTTATFNNSGLSKDCTLTAVRIG